MTNPQPEYGLVMPFLPVASKGGPHDDAAYVAGYEMGRLDALLDARGLSEHDATIHAENAAQADLVAMRHGYRTENLGEADGWLRLRFVRTELVAP